MITVKKLNEKELKESMNYDIISDKIESIIDDKVYDILTKSPNSVSRINNFNALFNAIKDAINLSIYNRLEMSKNGDLDIVNISEEEYKQIIKNSKVILTK